MECTNQFKNMIQHGLNLIFNVLEEKNGSGIVLILLIVHCSQNFSKSRSMFLASFCIM